MSSLSCLSTSLPLALEQYVVSGHFRMALEDMQRNVTLLNVLARSLESGSFLLFHMQQRTFTASSEWNGTTCYALYISSTNI
ncbi:hypothetical protein FKM82_022329 [Ascaphus truei]